MNGELLPSSSSLNYIFICTLELELALALSLSLSLLVSLELELHSHSRTRNLSYRWTFLPLIVRFEEGRYGERPTRKASGLSQPNPFYLWERYYGEVQRIILMPARGRCAPSRAVRKWASARSDARGVAGRTSQLRSSRRKRAGQAAVQSAPQNWRAIAGENAPGKP